MKIRISDKYKVNVDTRQFTLFKGNSVLGYYANMKQVLNRIIRYEAHDTDNKDLDVDFKEYLRLLEATEQKLVELVDKLFIEKKLTRKELEEHGE